MKSVLLLLGLLFFVSTCALAEVYFSEEFGDGWEQRWVVSKNKQSEGTAGEFTVSAGKYFSDAEADKGLKTSQDARFYQISAEFPDFSNKEKQLVLQYSAKHEQNIDCGGGYIKILPSGLDQEDFNGDSDYNIMFGPDICGTTRRTHVIFNYKGKNYLRTKDVPAKFDEFSHVYTLVVNPNNTYTVFVDKEFQAHGSLLEDFGILPPKEIPDPNVSKPTDWVDLKTIPDPEAVKPEGWDDIPKTIPDPNAVKPEDWDDDLDGEWEPPIIDNPEYKGPWVAPQIPNPEYKGEWVHPNIPNPDYHEDAEIYAYPSNKFVGIEVWQVKAGTIFDRILITDDLELAEEWADKTLAQNKDEVAQRDAEREKERQEREAAAEQAAKEAEKAQQEDGDDDDEDDDLVDDDVEIDEHDDDEVHDEL